jgi:hypothetical protein
MRNSSMPTRSTRANTIVIATTPAHPETERINTFVLRNPCIVVSRGAPLKFLSRGISLCQKGINHIDSYFYSVQGSCQIPILSQHQDAGPLLILCGNCFSSKSFQTPFFSFSEYMDILGKV